MTNLPVSLKKPFLLPPKSYVVNSVDYALLPSISDVKKIHSIYVQLGKNLDIMCANCGKYLSKSRATIGFDEEIDNCRFCGSHMVYNAIIHHMDYILLVDFFSNGFSVKILYELYRKHRNIEWGITTMDYWKELHQSGEWQKAKHLATTEQL